MRNQLLVVRHFCMVCFFGGRVLPTTLAPPSTTPLSPLAILLQRDLLHVAGYAKHGVHVRSCKQADARRVVHELRWRHDNPHSPLHAFVSRTSMCFAAAASPVLRGLRTVRCWAARLGACAFFSPTAGPPVTMLHVCTLFRVVVPSVCLHPCCSASARPPRRQAV